MVFALAGDSTITRCLPEPLPVAGRGAGAEGARFAGFSFTAVAPPADARAAGAPGASGAATAAEILRLVFAMSLLPAGRCHRLPWCSSLRCSLLRCTNAANDLDCVRHIHISHSTAL